MNNGSSFKVDNAFGLVWNILWGLSSVILFIIEKFYLKPNFFNGLGLENQERPVVIDLLKEYEGSETIFYFITKGDFLEPESFFETISHSSKNYF
ncbi:hypothetical protein CO726_15200 [Bacillus fungorum]|uniref:Uncharacterized protein n=1 Tax=Bacillus fungorum TaxID=2039284 RepID=A0A2G6QCM8_9BACI|nr:hypothetical protein CO726_15200 [Bacillus fungorum]